MLDLIFLKLKAGDGGDGRVSFYRTRHILKGGPDGGHGGDGGNVTLVGDKTINTLQHFAGTKEFVAENGQPGGPKHKIGKKSTNIKLKLPLGTVVWLAAENETSWKRRRRYGVESLMKKDEVEKEKFYVEKEIGVAPPREKDDVVWNEKQNFSEYLDHKFEEKNSQYQPLQAGKLIKLVEITRHGEEVVLCQGGYGGLGNDAFKSSRNTTPLEAQYGTFGEEKFVFLELRSLANVGLVGYPNAGKSTLLSILTKATPKVADYPFTTLEPHLGTLTLPDGKDLVVADIPGLIEGASAGKGLGFDFLRHIENCKMLIFVLALSFEVLSDEWLSDAEKAQTLMTQYRELVHELQEYNEQIMKKETLVLVNKTDLYSMELMQAIQAEFAKNKIAVLMVSAATGNGLNELKQTLQNIDFSLDSLSIA